MTTSDTSIVENLNADIFISDIANLNFSERGILVEGVIWFFG